MCFPEISYWLKWLILFRPTNGKHYLSTIGEDTVRSRSTLRRTTHPPTPDDRRDDRGDDRAVITITKADPFDKDQQLRIDISRKMASLCSLATSYHT